MDACSYALFFRKSGRSYDVLSRPLVCYAFDSGGRSDQSMAEDG